MATVNKDLVIKWSVLPAETPRIEFWYPADTPSYYARIYHGVSSNVPNRRIVKTVQMGVSAGGVRQFRNVGYDDELINLNVVLATKEEAEEFTNFFNIIQGSNNVFYFRNNFTGQESIVRFMRGELSMGESEGHPYSFSLLLRKETPYTGDSLTMKFAVIQVVIYASLFAGGFGNWSGLMHPTNSRNLYFSGENNSQFGRGDSVNSTRFEHIGSSTDWSKGAGGESHSLVLNDSGDLYVSGINNYGQLGLGDTFTRNTFEQLGSDSWVEISASLNFSAGIKSDGTLWAWGANNSGQLGQGTYNFVDNPTPLKIGTDTDWVDVKCGSSFLIAKKSNGTLWGCGWDDYGQLGQGSTQARRTSLVQIGVDSDWDSFSAGWAHTVALKADGTLWVCGLNDYGQLGLGDVVDRYSLVQVGADIWKSIAASYSTYGIKSDGTLWSWGFNSNWELGIGSSDSNPHSSPILINSDTDWRIVVAGGSHGMAAKTNDEIWGWGWNGRGEVGLGHTNAVSIPTRLYLAGGQLTIVFDVQSGGPPPPPGP